MIRVRPRVYLAQKEKPAVKDQADDIVRRFGCVDDAPTKKPGDVLANRTWTSTGGKTFAGRLVDISKDGRSVTLEPANGGKTLEVRIKQLSDHDQGLVKGLQALPANVSLEETAGLKKENQQKWCGSSGCRFRQVERVAASGKEFWKVFEQGTINMG